MSDSTAPVTADLLDAAQELRTTVDSLKFAEPVAWVYNPLDYAWAGYEAYVRRFATGPRRTVFLGMNPGPFGMTQTGVPFGEIAAVRDWMGIEVPIAQPERTHPKRPIQGFDCHRSEVSGRRLWRELFAERYPQADAFFAEHFVLNYCPLVFMTETGANYTPDKLKAAERAELEIACQHHLIRTLTTLKPQFIVGIGAYARKQIDKVAGLLPLDQTPTLGQIIHPAPASPIANREWPVRPRQQLLDLGVWSVTSS
ncbi:MAG: single-strand selective monofunctional uracil DNA glycosylase [Puniceicoccaceae bacterium 5H]|nr:MAG: single-strand selective monofunctional uracil DNA glycosylase [Puniceicoccaceae bacterium 5H]